MTKVAAPATALRAQLDPRAKVLRRYRQGLLETARAHGVRRVRVFGSVARGEEKPPSDVDLLAELEAGRTLLDLLALGVAGRARRSRGPSANSPSSKGFGRGWG